MHCTLILVSFFLYHKSQMHNVESAIVVEAESIPVFMLLINKEHNIIIPWKMSQVSVWTK